MARITSGRWNGAENPHAAKAGTVKKVYSPDLAHQLESVGDQVDLGESLAPERELLLAWLPNIPVSPQELDFHDFPVRVP
jgi:hypothetical protein